METEFCCFVIAGIKKQEKHEYFYHYLKKVLDSNLHLIPKSKVPECQELIKLEKNLSKLPESSILVSLKDLLITIQDFKQCDEPKKLLHAYKISGALQVLFTLYPDNIYRKEFVDIYNNSLNLSS
ncbi:hypothetical protein [Virgibacillus sp. JSM 102003]|uniref:hypothetical protein n=1 Tax=Virgibacillus sp. JSM 102003 TaxID=1562108 RepID=UPI0035C12866